MNKHLPNPSFLSQFFPKDEAGHEMIRPAFYFGFYFPDGYRQEYRRRAAQVCADYWQLCGQHLRWMISPLKCLWQSVPENYTIDQWLAAYPDEDWVWSMIFHSGETRSEAASYQVVGRGNSTEVYSYSNLFLSLPMAWFDEHPDQHPITLYLRWAQMLQARHGTAGFGLIPPEDTPKRGKTSPIAGTFAKLFPGVELVDYIGNQNVFYGLLSANWLNMVNAECVEQLGGIETIQGKLKEESLGHLVSLYPYEGGLILCSGEAPSLCENNQKEQPPLAYGPVARLLKPLRTPEPWGGWGCRKDESLAWLERFD